MHADQADQARQLLVDVTMLVDSNEHTGVQRLVRQVLRCLLAAPPSGFTVVPVHDDGGYYAYAHRFIGSAADDAPIHVRAGDIFLGLDLAPNAVPANLDALRSLRRHGVLLYFVVYDLLPIRLPHTFIAGAGPWFGRWVSSVAAVAHGLLCISRATADDLLDWLDENPVARAEPLQVGYFHLGADFQVGAKDAAVLHTQDTLDMPAGLDARPTLLMVGTLEPRKMHAQALGALEHLWAQGVDVNLVMVGREGWMMGDLARRLREHPELNRRLFWFEQADDGLLRRLYGAASGLLAASSGEGYGLPLIEAAQHGLPVIARDLPVFREVAGAHAYYFHADCPAELAAAVQDWLRLHQAGAAPSSHGMPWLTWEESARRLFSVIAEERWYRQASYRIAL